MKAKSKEAKKQKVRVRLRVGEDPRAWNVDTGEEVTDHVKEVRLMPGRKAVATVLSPDAGGEGLGEPKVEADVVRIEGIWEAR